MAMNDIKHNSSILENIVFSEIRNNDGCNVDKVSQRALQYANQPDHKIGFLGPWCSETVESIRGKLRVKAHRITQPTNHLSLTTKFGGLRKSKAHMHNYSRAFNDSEYQLKLINSFDLMTRRVVLFAPSGPLHVCVCVDR